VITGIWEDSMGKTVRNEKPNVYKSESGYVRKRTRRKARSRASQALQNGEYDDEDLFYSPKTEGRETW
jgi:hypothetical protein